MTRAGGVCGVTEWAGLAARTVHWSTITQIYEGTNQIQRMVMARPLLRGWAWGRHAICLGPHQASRWSGVARNAGILARQARCGWGRAGSIGSEDRIARS